MRTPEFWQKNNFLTILLQPIGWLFNLLGLLRRYLFPSTRIGIPVICSGNLVVGGAGKTPTAMFISNLLGKTRKVAILTTGYRGTLPGPIKVNPRTHTFREVGDEALLLAEIATTWVAKDRKEGALAAKADGAEVIIMDDGFQNPSICKDFSFIIVDGPYGFGNNKVLPAGPLRETIESGLSRADAVVLIGEDKHAIQNKVPPHIPVLTASIIAISPHGLSQVSRLLGFAGIGRPTKFLETLKTLGHDVIDFVEFPDHHNFQESELISLNQQANEFEAQLVTTKKDYIRLPENAQAFVKSIEMTLTWTDEKKLNSLLEQVLPHGD